MPRQGDWVLQAVEEHYRRVVETSPDGIILTDLTGTIVMANASAARLYGARHGEDLVGTAILDQVFVDDQRHMRDILEEALHRGYIRNAECRLHRPHGNFVVELAISVLTDDHEEPIGFVSTIRDITGQKLREQALKDQTLHDPLTGLPNRVLFHDRLTQAIESARRAMTQVAVLYIDLDDFKGVNDRFGHDDADTVLQQTAHRMQGTVRASDTLGRLGGDEFAAVLPQADAAGAAITARKLKHELAGSFEVAGRRVHVAASIGIAVFPAHGDDAATVLRRADMAMYAAKRRRGRNGIGRPEQVHDAPQEHRSPRASDSVAVQVDPRVLRLARVRSEIPTSQ